MVIIIIIIKNLSNETKRHMAGLQAIFSRVTVTYRKQVCFTRMLKLIEKCLRHKNLDNFPSAVPCLAKASSGKVLRFVPALQNFYPEFIFLEFFIACEPNFFRQVIKSLRSNIAVQVLFAIYTMSYTSVIIPRGIHLFQV